MQVARPIAGKQGKAAAAALFTFARPFFAVLVALLITGLLALSLTGCGSDGAQASTPMNSGGPETAGANDDETDPVTGTTSGPTYQIPQDILICTYDPSQAVGAETANFDLSHLAQGLVGASAQSEARLKFQVMKDEMSYNYDLPSDGTPIMVPLNMGDGMYTFRIMQNTSGTSYVEIAAVEQAVTLENEFAPFLRPSMFCDYNADSDVVAKARELAEGAANTGEVVRSIYTWVIDNVTYDTDKAKQLADATGYVPDPDDTLNTKKGICFDYASMTGAMLRSLGIPCRIITGYVSPNNLYHAWNMIYIDGQWVTAHFSIDPESWTRVDLTFAAAESNDSGTIGDGTEYTDRYVY